MLAGGGFVGQVMELVLEAVAGAVDEEDLPVVLDDGSQYVYGAGLVSQIAGANTYYYLADGLGSTMAMVDTSGAVQKSYTYDVYGAPTATGAVANEFDFAGQETDPSTGLQYLRARYMDPATGRFVSRDPLARGRSWTEHGFAYGRANPASHIDPTGLWCPKDPSDCVDAVTQGADPVKSAVESVASATSDAAGAAVDAIEPTYIDVNLSLIVPVILPIGVVVTTGCQVGLDSGLEVHCYVGGGVGLSVPPLNAGISVSVAPQQTISQGLSCGVQASVTGPELVGATEQVGVGGIDEKGGGSPFVEAGVTVGTPGVAVTGTCYYVFP